MKHKNKDDQIEKILEENRRLKTQLNNCKKEIKKLKSELRTSDKAWNQTEGFLKNVTEGRSLKEVIRDVNLGEGLSTLNNYCNKCGSITTTVKFSSFRVLICPSCKSRQKIEEKYSDD